MNSEGRSLGGEERLPTREEAVVRVHPPLTNSSKDGIRAKLRDLDRLLGTFNRKRTRREPLMLRVERQGNPMETQLDVLRRLRRVEDQMAENRRRLRHYQEERSRYYEMCALDLARRVLRETLKSRESKP